MCPQPKVQTPRHGTGSHYLLPRSMPRRFSAFCLHSLLHSPWSLVTHLHPYQNPAEVHSKAPSIPAFPESHTQEEWLPSFVPHCSKPRRLVMTMNIHSLGFPCNFCLPSRSSVSSPRTRTIRWRWTSNNSFCSSNNSHHLGRTHCMPGTAYARSHLILTMV